MASCFMTVSKDEILVVSEAASPTNTKKETKFGLSVITGLSKKIFFNTEFATKLYRMIPETLSIET